MADQSIATLTTIILARYRVHTDSALAGEASRLNDQICDHPRMDGACAPEATHTRHRTHIRPATYLAVVVHFNADANSPIDP